MERKIVAIIQARTTSTRLPNKVLMKLGGKSIIENIVDRVSHSKHINDLVVATSIEKSDDTIETLLQDAGVNVFRGSLNNVLERFYYCAEKFNADIVIRFTADNALIAPELIDAAINAFLGINVDYLYYKEKLPLGMGIEIFTFNALKRAFSEAQDAECLEHVTPYIRENPQIFKVFKYKDKNDEDNSGLRFTIDTWQDYDFVSKVYDSFDRNTFSYSEILKLVMAHPEWIKINHDVVQNELEYNGEA